MRCPRCDAENPDTSRFCVSCATPLPGTGQAAELRGSPSPGDQPSAGSPHDFPPHTSATGRLVAGKYEIAEEIGRGGMGVVYKARDAHLERWVALKFLPSSLAGSEELRERFLVEARAAAALAHPNICVIHEVGEDEGQSFLAMEYVEGETLRQRIKRGALDAADALALMVQIAAGLEEAHHKGVIHRDIKSSNIMVTAQGQAKVMDFGLAKLRGGPELTKTQTTLGTVAYMSPEQAGGEDVDHRTDLWSAGVVLYEMLTGELPFRGHHDLAVIHAIMTEEPKWSRDRTRAVPQGVREVVSRALQKKPQARYASAGEMLRDLRRYEEARAAEAARVVNVRSLLRRLREPRVAAAAAVGLVAVAAFSVWYAQRRADIRWAREVALPEIEQMIADNDLFRNLVPAFYLAEEAEAILGDDPELAELFAQVSLHIDILTEPPGASVFVKEYATPEAEWAYLGVTPLEQVRMPIGVFRWKLEKEGYETVLAAESTWGGPAEPGDMPATPRGNDLMRVLDREGELPEGMVRISADFLPEEEGGDFFIGRYEVTNREYKAFVDAGGYRSREYWKHPFVAEGRELTWEEAMAELMDQSGLPGPATWMGGVFPRGQEDYPVSGVSWYEAAAYAEYRGMSLPASPHWGSARGYSRPMIRVYQYGGGAVLSPFSNFNSPGPVPVGSLPSLTPFGTFDMPGNVREWCWNETPNGRVIRGGAWDDNVYEFNRLAQAPPMDRSPKNGLRLAVYPDRDVIPAAVFQAQAVAGAVRDFHGEPHVPDAVYQVYKEQFAYDEMDLNARVEYRGESAGGWIREKVSFDAAYGGERVPAHLFLPANTPPPYQTVIYFPGAASTWGDWSEDIESYYEYSMFLSFLVTSGRAVLYPVYKGTFERMDPALTTIHAGRGSRAYAEYLVQLVKDFKRSVDYLETRPDIDSRRLAYYGMSWGGPLGAIIPAVEERIQASVLLGGYLPYTPAQQPRPEADPFTYVSRVKAPTLMLNGRYDAALEDGIEPMFDLLGTPPEHKRLILYETDHIPPRLGFVKETLAWLDRYLGPVGR